MLIIHYLNMGVCYVGTLGALFCSVFQGIILRALDFYNQGNSNTLVDFLSNFVLSNLPIMDICDLSTYKYNSY